MSIEEITRPRVTPLRDAQKAFTRNRICEAARELFFVQGFARTTIDQIAEAAGTRRSTLYTHFKDKEEILQEIAEAYAVGLLEVVAEVPCPRPTRSDIDAWVESVAQFVAGERTPTVLLTDLGNAPDVPTPIHQIGAALLSALAERLPAFRRATVAGPEQGLAYARATVVLRELSWACLQYARASDEAVGRNLLTVAAELFERFVHEHA
jgi:AcrR family transcriptional regulator